MLAPTPFRHRPSPKLSLATPITIAVAVAALAADPPHAAEPPTPPPPALGGPYEPAEPALVVEGKPDPAARPWTIRSDPRLERRYAPRERSPVNRLVVRF